MAATVTIRRWTGSSGGPTKTDVTSINSRMNAYDGHSTNDTTNPIQIPAAGSNYSFWASFRLSVDANAGGATIDNIKWYSDGSNNYGTGITMKVATGNSYVQATGTDGETGTELTEANHGDLDGAPSDAFGYTSGSPLSVAGSTTSTGDLGDFVVAQLIVASTASSGASAQETFTFSYDEA